ncbi:MAG: adenylate/guanylate cyclase domain-containing protein [Flavobacteriales bacterium]|nr:adenylate/guanylate cyclase domain-containing protein [Flavobacteriales bacterium]MCB0782199.1 adenylate/guanylate cyclase domain-containing protein [Flavobacteriales bacterium]
MSRTKALCSLALGLICTLADGQGMGPSQFDTTYARFVDSRFSDPSEDLSTLMQLEAYASARKDSCALARINSWKSSCHDALGQLDSSIFFGHKGLRFYHSGCDSLSLMSIQANLTSTYLSLGENDKVIAIADKYLALWNENWPRASSKKAFLTNKAIAQVYKGEFELGLRTFKELLFIAEREGDRTDQMDACNNIAAIFGMRYEDGGHASYLDSSENYVRKALNIGRSLGKTEEVVIHYLNLGVISKDKKNYTRSLAYLDSAMVIAREAQFLQLASTIAQVRSDAFEGMGKLDSSLAYLRIHAQLKDSLLDHEKVRAISDMQEKYESEKKERQIKELEVHKLSADLREEQLTRTRNIYLFVGLGVMLVAGGLWSRLRYTRRAKAILQVEKDRSEELLLNILPEEVAEELKEKGEAEARLIEQVTVLFTDFKGFTAMSEKLSPKELVKDLHECFSTFDRICEAHGLEKIKTIGDAYMAAGGLPTPNTTHATDVIHVALEMRDFIAEGKARKLAAGLPYFEIRIGVHTGPVVAGIVGVKKFSYDIWGDTVNTASRMESSGEPGKVNISEATYALVKDTAGLTFTPRGKVEAKGKGEMEMFFVEPGERRP